MNYFDLRNRVPGRRILRAKWLIPVVCRKEVTYSGVLNAASAHVRVIHWDYLLWEVVFNVFISLRLAFNSLPECQKTGNLYISLEVPLRATKSISFLRFSDRDFNIPLGAVRHTLYFPRAVPCPESFSHRPLHKSHFYCFCVPVFSECCSVP